LKPEKRAGGQVIALVRRIRTLARRRGGQASLGSVKKLALDMIRERFVEPIKDEDVAPGPGPKDA
jgi:hypothetical protein